MNTDLVVASVAVLSDVHGVLPALEAVLAEPDVAAAERIVLTGDIAAGPQPVEALDRLVELGERAVWVRGNTDRALVTLARGGSLGARVPIMEWGAAQLRSDQVELLDALPHPVTLHVDGFGEVLFCHATPRDDDEIVLVDSPMDRWAEVLETVPEGVSTIVCGHTHLPFVRLAHGFQVVNAGSVGMPFGRPGAQWALLADGAISLRRTMFDLDEACATVTRDSTFPEVAEWADFHIHARTSDAEALEKLRNR